MNPKVKFTLAASFKGLLSRGSPWWVAVIFLVFSSFLPLLPTFSQLSKMDGASFLSGYNYGLQEQIADFAYEMHDQGKEFMVEGGKLHYYDNFDYETHTGTEIEFVDTVADENYFLDEYRKCEYKIVNDNPDIEIIKNRLQRLTDKAGISVKVAETEMEGFEKVYNSKKKLNVQ